MRQDPASAASAASAAGDEIALRCDLPRRHSCLTKLTYSDQPCVFLVLQIPGEQEQPVSPCACTLSLPRNRCCAKLCALGWGDEASIPESKRRDMVASPGRSRPNSSRAPTMSFSQAGALTFWRSRPAARRSTGAGVRQNYAI